MGHWHAIAVTRVSSEYEPKEAMKTTEPNQALEPTTTAVTDRAPSSTLRASCGRGSP